MELVLLLMTPGLSELSTSNRKLTGLRVLGSQLILKDFPTSTFPKSGFVNPDAAIPLENVMSKKNEVYHIVKVKMQIERKTKDTFCNLNSTAEDTTLCTKPQSR